MRITRNFSMIALSLGMVWLSGFAANAGESFVPRIGVVRIQKIFLEYQYAKDQKDKIKELFDKDEAALKNLDKQIRERSERLAHDPLIGKGTKQWKLEMLEIQKLKIEKEERIQQVRVARDKHRAEVFRSIHAHFRAAIDKYAEAYKFDLVITAPDMELTKGEDQPSAMIQNEILLQRVQFVSKHLDITDMILELMNRSYAKRKKTAKGL